MDPSVTYGSSEVILMLSECLSNQRLRPALELLRLHPQFGRSFNVLHLYGTAAEMNHYPTLVMAKCLPRADKAGGLNQVSPCVWVTIETRKCFPTSVLFRPGAPVLRTNNRILRIEQMGRLISSDASGPPSQQTGSMDSPTECPSNKAPKA
jgi:hypothetical protein